MTAPAHQIIATPDLKRPFDGRRIPTGGIYSEARRLVSRVQEASQDDTLWPFLFRHASVSARFSVGPCRAFKSKIPRITSRYLRDYLALDLGVPERRAIQLFHYEFLARRFAADRLDEILDGAAELWRMVSDERVYTLSMRVDKSFYGEGDLVLELKEDGVCVSDMSFSLAPGRFAGVDGEAAILVTRLQGRPKLFSAIQRTTKAVGDISPGHILLAAVEGVAAAFSIATLCGVSTRQQLSTRGGVASFNYDGFWADLVGERHGDWYRTSMPIPRKPLSEVSKSHRRRTKRKRQVKADIAARVAGSLGAYLR